MERNIIEIFSSIQGEGKYAGCRQVFVRFEGCNLNCRYCDTENQPGTHRSCQVEAGAGSRRFEAWDNPLSSDQVSRIIERMLLEVPHQAVSFTGGEPLLHAAFIHDLAQRIRKQTKVFLETNGSLPEALERILEDVDIISMDIKMPGITGKDLWEQHRSFMDIGKEKELYVKMVISDETQEDEFHHAVKLMAGVVPQAMCILQPVTPCGGCKAASPQKVLQYQAYALRYLSDVRVIPQTHKMIGQM